jgi:hypothetical protein
MKAWKTNTERRTDEHGMLAMIWFIFIGDMLVMLFMCTLVVWFFMRSSSEVANAAARIPLEDEHEDD